MHLTSKLVKSRILTVFKKKKNSGLIFFFLNAVPLFHTYLISIDSVEAWCLESRAKKNHLPLKKASSRKLVVRNLLGKQPPVNDGGERCSNLPKVRAASKLAGAVSWYSKCWWVIPMDASEVPSMRTGSLSFLYSCPWGNLFKNGYILSYRGKESLMANCFLVYKTEMSSTPLPASHEKSSAKGFCDLHDTTDVVVLASSLLYNNTPSTWIQHWLERIYLLQKQLFRKKK